MNKLQARVNNSTTDRLDRIERILETVAQRQEAISQQQEINIRSIELLGQRVDSNAKAIESLTSDIAANRADIAATRASVDGLVQTISELGVRSEARLSRLEDAVVGIERILERLTRRDHNGDQP